MYVNCHKWFMRDFIFTSIDYWMIYYIGWNIFHIRSTNKNSKWKQHTLFFRNTLNCVGFFMKIQILEIYVCDAYILFYLHNIGHVKRCWNKINSKKERLFLGEFVKRVYIIIKYMCVVFVRARKRLLFVARIFRHANLFFPHFLGWGNICFFSEFFSEAYLF